MNFIDCIKGHLQEGRLKPAKAQELLDKYERLVDRYTKAGQGAGAAEKAAQDLVNKEAAEAVARARNLRNHALKQKELDNLLKSKPGSIYNKVSDVYQRAVFRGEGVRATVYSFMDTIADKIKGNFLNLSRDHALFEKGVRAALGETVEDADASKIGDIIRQTYDYLHSRYKSSGGVVGKLDNYYPQTHRAEALRRVTKDEWTQFVLDRANMEQMLDEATGLPFEPKKLQGILGEVYDDIVTDGRSSLARDLESGKTGAGGGSPFEQRRNMQRFIHFKDTDSFIEYNAKFGTGENGLMQSFLDSIDSYSRDIGILETLGPRPDSMSQFLSAKMRVDGKSDIKRTWVDAQYRVLRGLGSGDTDTVWWKVLSGFQNWVRSAALGSASISAISDTAFISATAKMNGLSSVRALGRYAKVLTGNSELKQIAARSGFLVDVINGSVLSDTRFAGEGMTGKFTGALAQATNKLSGLHSMTKATQDSIALEFNATLADLVSKKTSWEKLNPELKAAFGKVDLNEKNWADLLNAEVLSSNGAKFIITNDMRFSKTMDPKVSGDLANKIDDLTFAMRQQAANEALLATRAVTTGAVFGDGRPGSLSRALASSIFMFKTFPITGILTHTLPAIRRVQSQRKFDHLAQVMIGTTIMGAIPLVLKDLIKGKQIEDPNKVFNAKFLTGAMMQGGGFGLFGDFLFQDYSRFGRGPITEFMGPLAGTVNDIYRATKGNFDKYIYDEDPNFLRDSFRIVKRNIPVVGSLWYTRLALERLVLDNMERLTDPEFDSKMRKLEQKMMKDQGKSFWWGP